MKKRIAAESFLLSRADLERYLIKTYKLPEDIVVTNIGRMFSQEAWMVTVQSSQFEHLQDFATTPWVDHKLLKESNE